MKTLIDNLVRKIPDNIFYDIPLADKEKEKGRIAGKENIVFGVNTSDPSRKAMIDLLVMLVNDDPEILAIPEVYEEIKTLVYDKKGKVEHDHGKHDDSLFSYLFVRYAVAYSNTIHIFLRKSSNMVENAAVIIKAATRVGPPTEMSEVNKVDKISADIAALSIEELMHIKDSGIKIEEFIKNKQKNPALDGRRELKINQTLLAALRK